MKRSRKLIFPLFLLFLLFGAIHLIFDIIYKYPVTYVFDKIVWNTFTRALLGISMCLVLFWKQCKWIKNAYVWSYNQWLAYGSAMLLFVFARFGENWDFLRLGIDKPLVAWQWQPLTSDVKLIDILWLSLLYPLLSIFKLVFPKLYGRLYSNYVKIYDSISEKYRDFIQKETPQNENAFFEEDLPLKDYTDKKFSADKESQEVKDPEKKNALTDDESEQYKELTDVLVPKLVKQKFQKAFSIGIIGPYGNGKSSLVNHLEAKFKKELKTKRFEIIEFLPAYSHKPEQISTDFFTILASRLKKYHGSLNNSMLSYAAKLIELGVNGKKDIQGLLKPTDWFSENKSASQAYLELKKIFTQIDIKTIVIIDDVDRLGKEEILEVLRIIRNTANFPNTIFIVAYDKDYVIKTTEQDLLYLDKYFQYELFVPPHRREDLLKSFSEMVLSKDTGIDSEKLEKVIKVGILNKTLLDKFVLNYRDVKVLTNIYCTNLSLLAEDVDFIDLLHFTLLNKHFPKQVRYIYNNFGEIFDSKKDHQIGTGIVKTLKLKVFDSLKTPFTVDALITALEIKDSSLRNLFKRLFMLLFGIKDNTLIKEMHSGASEEEKLSEIHKKLQNIPYSPEIEFSIKNIERTHIYFELFLRDDDLSNVEFALKIGTDNFIDYINELLNKEKYREARILKEKIKNKLEYYHGKLDSKTKIDNAIKVAPFVGGDLTQILFYHVQNYKHISDGLFNEENDFITFFKEKLWNNMDIKAEYIIHTILTLDKYVRNKKEKDGDDCFDVPPYIGLTDVEVKEILISKTKEIIKECTIVDLNFLKQLSKILDCGLNLTNRDIDFSNYLYANQDRLFEYLKIVEKFYREGFEFSSAIFKVFTPKEFKENCVDKFPNKKLIREFHHLLELHDIRKDAVSLSEFTPFYFSNKKTGQYNSDQYKQTIYVQKTGDFKVISGTPEIEEKDVYAKDIRCNRAIIEGKRSYDELFQKIKHFSSLQDIEIYLSKNEDKFEILSIQTPEQIDGSLLPYIKYYKTLNDETITPVV